MTMSGINTTIANYIAAWNETDADKRRHVIANAWTEAGTYLDSHRESTGHDAIDRMIAAVQQMFPGYRFRLSSGIDLHHDRVRFSWQAGGAPDAPLFFAGTDYATIAPDGRFSAVTGFTDAMPSLT
jgi:SnoaL-like domain